MKEVLWNLSIAFGKDIYSEKMLLGTMNLPKAKSNLSGVRVLIKEFMSTKSFAEWKTIKKTMGFDDIINVQTFWTPDNVYMH